MPLAGLVTMVLGLVAAAALASCVTVIAVQLWQASKALADVEEALATLPPLAGLEPTLDVVNGSLSRVAAEIADRRASVR